MNGDVNAFFQGGAVLAIMTYLVMALKDTPKWIWDRIERKIIYRVNIDELDELYYYFEKWLIANHAEKYRNVEASLNFIKNNDAGVGHNNSQIKKDINYKQYEDFFIVKYMGKRLYIWKGREKFENASNIKSAFFNRYRISGLFGRKQIEALMKEVLEYNLKLEIESRKINIYTNSVWGEWYLIHDLKTKDINDVVIDHLDKLKLIDDITTFEKSESWYNQRSISYKRGYLFYGPPGNGKTSLCLSLAQKLKRDIYFLNDDLSNNAALNTAMQGLKPNSILALEDADCMFNKRVVNEENKELKSFNFSTFLNCLDGAFSKENVITIMTTNHEEKLDPALIRTGRIDMKLKINNPSKQLIEQYMGIFYGSPVQLKFPIHSNQHLSMSTVQDICIRNRNNVEDAVYEIKDKLYESTQGARELATRTV
jgi:mitochondrial chaperone BCS1